MYLHELPKMGVELRLPAGDSAVEQAVAAYERQCRTQVKRVGPKIFVPLFAPTGLGRPFFSVPDHFLLLKFEWLVLTHEECVSYQSSSVRDTPPGLAVLIPHSGGEPLRPFGRERGKASFSARSLLVERLNWVQPKQGQAGLCTVCIQTVQCSLRPRFRHSREEREECNLPKESPYGFDSKVEALGNGITIQLDLTREGGVEQVVQPTIGWAELSPARQAALRKFLCGEHLEDYRLDAHERWRRYKQDATIMREPEWQIPFDYAADRAKPLWERSRNPQPQRFPASLGLDGLPVRTGKSCDHLHFAQGLDPAHQEPQEEDQDGGWYGNDDDRW